MNKCEWRSRRTNEWIRRHQTSEWALTLSWEPASMTADVWKSVVSKQPWRKRAGTMLKMRTFYVLRLGMETEKGSAELCCSSKLFLLHTNYHFMSFWAPRRQRQAWKRWRSFAGWNVGTYRSSSSDARSVGLQGLRVETRGLYITKTRRRLMPIQSRFLVHMKMLIGWEDRSTQAGFTSTYKHRWRADSGRSSTSKDERLSEALGVLLHTHRTVGSIMTCIPSTKKTKPDVISDYPAHFTISAPDLHHSLRLN